MLRSEFWIRKTLNFTLQVLHGSGWLSEHVGGRRKRIRKRGCGAWDQQTPREERESQNNKHGVGLTYSTKDNKSNVCTMFCTEEKQKILFSWGDPPHWSRWKRCNFNQPPHEVSVDLSLNMRALCPLFFSFSPPPLLKKHLHRVIKHFFFLTTRLSNVHLHLTDKVADAQFSEPLPSLQHVHLISGTSAACTPGMQPGPSGGWQDELRS